MKIEDKRNEETKCAGLGDLLVTSGGTTYLVMNCNFICRGYAGLYDVGASSLVSVSTTTEIYRVGKTVPGADGWETVVEIVPHGRLKLVIV